MAYDGPERRRHRVLVTRHTEYHLRDRRCVAVRDAITMTWQRQHLAVGQELLGGVAPLPNGSLTVTVGTADVGHQACFANDLMTTPVQRILRPSRDTVGTYPRVALG